MNALTYTNSFSDACYFQHDQIGHLSNHLTPIQAKRNEIKINQVFFPSKLLGTTNYTPHFKLINDIFHPRIQVLKPPKVLIFI